MILSGLVNVQIAAAFCGYTRPLPWVFALGATPLNILLHQVQQNLCVRVQYQKYIALLPQTIFYFVGFYNKCAILNKCN